MPAQMTKSKSRINITLELDSQQGKQKKELPFKLLILGDFTQQENHKVLGQHECISVNKSNFNQVMADLAPSVHIQAKDSENIECQFSSIKDFHPEQIIKQVPELQQLFLMRNYLKELKSHVLDNQALRTELEKIIKTPEALTKLRHRLNDLAFIGGTNGN